MSQILLFKIFLFFSCFSFIFSSELKPNNSNDLIKINVDGKNRSYYHLDKNKELVYSFKNEGIEDLADRFGLKIISRTVIASNSNSNKTFGLNFNVYEEETLIDSLSHEITYNKRVSDATSDSKPGWNFTKAGFWFQELDSLENKTVRISLMKGSPEVELKLIYDKIILRSGKKELIPINKAKEYSVLYTDDAGDLVTSDNWYLLNESNVLQFKISGPKIIRFISRALLETDNNKNQLYSFKLRGDGRFISNYNHVYSDSESGAIIKESNEKLSSYNSSFYNIPKGIHYYSFILNNEDSFLNDVFLKLEVYNENK